MKYAKPTLPPLRVDLLGKVLEDIAALDANLGQGGLYAADQDLVFTKVLIPFLKAHDYRIDFGKGGRYVYYVPKGGDDGAYAHLETFSKIKVRLFGNQHVIDRHVHHDARWDEKTMGRLISTLWSESPQRPCGLILVLGYDAKEPVLSSEFRALEKALNWDSHGVLALNKTWPDPHKRSFFTSARLWTRRPESPE